MPIYRNPRSIEVRVVFDDGVDLIFPPKTEMATPYPERRYISLQRYPELELVSEEPFYNPFAQEEVVLNFVGVETKEIAIDFEDTKEILITDVASCKLDCFINSQLNTPPFEILTDATLLIPCNNNVYKLYLTSDINGSCKLVKRHFREKGIEQTVVSVKPSYTRVETRELYDPT